MCWRFVSEAQPKEQPWYLTNLDLDFIINFFSQDFLAQIIFELNFCQLFLNLNSSETWPAQNFRTSTNSPTLNNCCY